MNADHICDRLRALVFAAASRDRHAVFALADYCEEHGIDHPCAAVAIRARAAGDVTHLQYQAFRAWNSELICGPGKLILQEREGPRRFLYNAFPPVRGRQRRR